ncbi:uncharacterized protein BDV17DRAFT_287868 [Aspergillus undulatus]|uniref:uncharacterized protein n=1 Tax=Aspergillus undulatus TaxID=1810928 RepID=UPI003CCD25F6
MTLKLLADVPCQIEALTVRVGKRPLATQVVPDPDFPDIASLDSSTTPHTVLKVKLLSNKEKEVWILDISAAQYGFRDVLVPYKMYMSIHECRIAGGPYDSAQLETLNAECPARARFALSVNGINKDILDGSSKEFEDKLKDFKTALKPHMSLPGLIVIEAT